MAPMPLKRQETPLAVNLGQERCQGGLAFCRNQSQLVPEIMLNGDRGPMPPNPGAAPERGLQSLRLG
jgi:hypothetical protein